ncbi:glycosyltransferase family 1 protein [Bacillus timonensis]|uniref:Glycosyltransferase family 1 protein n=1 Tax=Bacillus timonensis TaxID=1033734 RepID=A0A4S3PSB6_9BACI|nr:glycosyltransferase family 4 protein [Bacillus timonensis]THE12304.1 glycosyltransferase family 1 protein [Bacillus timonensis]
MEKILYMLNYPGIGGTEKYVLDLIRAIGAKNCVFIYSDDGPGLDMFKQTGIKMYQVKMRGPFDIKAARKIKQIIKNENIQVVHCQFLRENYIALLSKLVGSRTRVIWTYHVDVPMNPLIRFINRIFTAFNRQVIAVSQFMVEQLEQKGVSPKKIRLIYNGVLPPVHSNLSILNGKTVRVSVVGRLREEKGHKFLLKSLAEMNRLYPSVKWECNIFGEGPLEQELQKLSEQLEISDKVIFKGFATNKDDIYLNSDIIVVPSSNEALSYVAIEALAYSRVVVATNVGGLPEVIIDGETGILVDYGNTEQMASKLAEVITNKDLYYRLSVQGYSYFHEHFTIEKMIHDTTKLYNLRFQTNVYNKENI